MVGTTKSSDYLCISRKDLNLVDNYEPFPGYGRDVTGGLETICHNLSRNLNELDHNQKYLRYHKSGVHFIGTWCL